MGYVEQFTRLFVPQEVAYANEAEVLLSFENYTDSFGIGDRVPTPTSSSPPYRVGSMRGWVFYYLSYFSIIEIWSRLNHKKAKRE